MNGNKIKLVYEYNYTLFWSYWMSKKWRYLMINFLQHSNWFFLEFTWAPKLRQCMAGRSPCGILQHSSKWSIIKDSNKPHWHTDHVGIPGSALDHQLCLLYWATVFNGHDDNAWSMAIRDLTATCTAIFKR